MNKHRFILNAFKLGIMKPVFVYHENNLIVPEKKIENIQDREYFTRINAGEKAATSLLGTPVFAEVELKENKAGGLSVNLQWVIVTIDMQKNIVKTVIQGRNGSVKEYISDGDYNVLIQGGIFSENPSKFPVDETQVLLSLCKLPESLKFNSSYISMFDIDELVVESFNFRQESGFQNIHLFELRCISDDSIELRMANE